ncbi:acyltransferase domain-containing protein [Actinopolymorpha sp. NPDC004070]|uniref:acyltransferase domain-containing protein n=1 Tax=Actinopolymorpha sp. NPDC004070 TaxID=3154548 RepID=UPI0033BCDDE1
MDVIGEFVRDEAAAKEFCALVEALDEPRFEVVLPPADDLPPLLLDLAVPHEDIDELTALLPSRERDARVWRFLEYCTRLVVSGMGTVTPEVPFPELSPAMGALRRYFYVYVYLAALPHVRAFHRERGIPGDVSRLTLADLGRVLADHRFWYGTGGLDTELASWLTGHFRGALYQLGRLQFQRAKLGNRTGKAVTAAGQPYGPGDPVLAVHVPATYGPMTPAACDRSFAMAHDFFARHFPEEDYHLAACYSWLLDEQLAEYLPAESNIVRFQRRFRPAYVPKDDDAGILRFVFGRVGTDLADLPRRSTLQRAILDHLQAGHHWHGGAGWCVLGSDPAT